VARLYRQTEERWGRPANVRSGPAPLLLALRVLSLVRTDVKLDRYS